jgi:hypothetical protein
MGIACWQKDWKYRNTIMPTLPALASWCSVTQIQIFLFEKCGQGKCENIFDIADMLWPTYFTNVNTYLLTAETFSILWNSTLCLVLKNPIEDSSEKVNN